LREDRKCLGRPLPYTLHLKPKTDSFYRMPNAESRFFIPVPSTQYPIPNTQYQIPIPSLKFLRREGDHIIDVVGIRKKHHQAIDAKGIAGGRGHVV